jgi:hypothetical protein
MVDNVWSTGPGRNKIANSVVIASGAGGHPIGDVVVTQRPEISSEIYDVEGCRQRARYSCFHERYGAHCVREPDPR